MNLTADIVDYGIMVNSEIIKLKQTIEQQNTMIQSLNKQIETNKKEKKAD